MSLKGTKELYDSLPSEMNRVIFRKERDRFSRPASSPSPADPVDVANSGCREVVIDDHVYPLEVNATAHQLRGYQHPDLAGTETSHNVVTLKESNKHRK